jgi:hypothetical protein
LRVGNQQKDAPLYRRGKNMITSPDPAHLDDHDYWLKRGAEFRARAAVAIDPVTKANLLAAAEQYEQLPARIDKAYEPKKSAALARS